MQRVILKTKGIPEISFLETGMDQVLDLHFAGIQYDGKLRYIICLTTTNHDLMPITMIIPNSNSNSPKSNAIPFMLING